MIKLMRMLTFMDLEEIAQIEESMKSEGYLPNTAQKRLAQELTVLVHGQEGLEKAQKVTEGAAPGAKGSSLDASVLSEIASDMPNVNMTKEQVVGIRYTELAALSGLVSSKGEATRLVAGGGAYLNNDKVDDASYKIEIKDLIGDQFILLGMGKKKKILIRLT